MAFADDVKRFALDVRGESDKVVRTATLELFSGIIRSTPVDTGRARGNWQTSVGQPQGGTLERTGMDAALAEVQATVPEGAGQLVYLSNNLPYIERLENGWSQQAPIGMVRINVDRVRQMLATLAARNRG